MARKSIDWMKTIPELLNEWNYEKNNIMPSDISIWSKNKVWWKCKYGHEWASTMNSRQKKSGCPYCAGLLPIVGVNDLQTTNPELMKEWDYQKNIIKPYEIKVGSGMKIWWKCKEGHSWEATPNHRKKGQGCPYCSGKKVLAGFNDINTLRPNIAKEWDYEKNENKTPDMYTVRSGSKVWWRCKEGHSWKAVIASRTGKKYVQCPYCSGRLPIVGTNDLQTTNPDLIKEWNYEKNSPIYPYMVKKGSNNKIWWKCEKGHEWQAEISARTSGKSGCPYCAGRKTIQGENDLVSIESKLLSEWNYKKNDGKKPSDFKMHSGALVWWKCERGHEWQAKIADRSRGDGCPYCSGKRLMVGFNDLAHVYPYLAKEWNYEKNQGKMPEDVTSKAGIKVWWKCEKGHEWQALISNRSRGDGCPICNSGIRTSFPEQAIFYYIKKIYPDALNRCTQQLGGKRELDIFIPSKQVGIEYDGSVWHSSEKALNREVKKYEECIKQGIFLIRVKEKNGVLKEGSCDVLIRTDSNYNNETYKKLFSELNNYIDIPDDIDVVRDRIHILENYRTELKNKSVGTLYPHLVLEWDTEKNGLLTPFMFTPGSGEKVWWICNMNHRWQASIVSRTKGSKCPYCSGICVIRGKNDLATLRPDIAAEWNDEKNGELKPCNLKIKSNKKVWWKCKNGHEWQAIISNRTNKNQGCPFCKKDDSES